MLCNMLGDSRNWIYIFFSKKEEIPEEEDTHDLHSLSESSSSENHQIQSGTVHQSTAGQSAAAGSCWVDILPKHTHIGKLSSLIGQDGICKSLLTNLENQLMGECAMAHIHTESDLTAKFLKLRMNKYIWTTNFAVTAYERFLKIWRDFCKTTCFNKNTLWWNRSPLITLCNKQVTCSSSNPQVDLGSEMFCFRVQSCMCCDN